MPNIAWHCFTAGQLHTIFANKIDRLTDCDGERQIMFESIFTIRCIDKGIECTINYCQQEKAVYKVIHIHGCFMAI